MVTVFSDYSTLLQLRRRKNGKFPLPLIDFKVIEILTLLFTTILMSVSNRPNLLNVQAFKEILKNESGLTVHFSLIYRFSWMLIYMKL